MGTLGNQRPVTSGTTGNPYYAGGQHPGYGRGMPGVKSPGTTGNQPVTSNTPVGGSGTQGGNGTVANPWSNPGGNVGSSSAPPQNQYPVTTMAMGEEGGSGGPAVTPTPGVKPQHPLAGVAPPPTRPPVQQPYYPPSIGKGAEQDYRLNKAELKNLSPQERAQANQKAHNLRAADNRHDVNQRQAMQRAQANQAPKPPVPPPPPMVGGPHPFLPPGTNIHPPQRFDTQPGGPMPQMPPQMQIPPGSQVVNGGYDTQPGGRMPGQQFDTQPGYRSTPPMVGGPALAENSQFTQALMRALGG